MGCNLGFVHSNYDYPGFNTRQGFFYTGDGYGYTHGYAYGRRPQRELMVGDVNDGRYIPGTQLHPDWI